MSGAAKRWLFWTPRVLSIVFILFVSMFALDVFEEARGFWSTALGLSIHLIPSLFLIGFLLLAWRWEWVGAVCFGAAGALYTISTLFHPWPPLGIKVSWIVTIAGPAFLIAVLFLINWRKHDEMRAR